MYIIIYGLYTYNDIYNIYIHVYKYYNFIHTCVDLHLILYLPSLILSMKTNSSL